MERRNREILLATLVSAVLLLLTVSCRIKVPEEVIQPDRMEKLLYDYHLAQAMTQDNRGEGNYGKELYFRYVFDKHRTTREHFDSSMVWYTRNPKYLSVIYENLSQRLRGENNRITQYLEQQEGKSYTVMSGDTVDLWILPSSQWLWDRPLTNKISFSIPADTTFYVGDRYEWSMDFRFLEASAGLSSAAAAALSASDTAIRNDNTSSRQSQAYAVLSLQYENDSVVAVDTMVAVSGKYKLTLACDSVYKQKELRGYLYYLHAADTLPAGTPLFLSYIVLNRYHRLNETAVLKEE